MESNEFISLNEVIEKHTSNEELARIFYIASRYMQMLHSNGLYITNFDPKHIKTNGESVVFERTEQMTNRIIGDEVKSNIEAFNSFMIGSYINYINSLLPYTKLKEFYNDVKYSFPEEDEAYFNASINEAKIMYYHQYVDNRRNFIEGMVGSNVNVKTKTTQAGKLVSEREYYKQAAFANVLVISAIVCLITLVAVLTYVILK